MEEKKLEELNARLKHFCETFSIIDQKNAQKFDFREALAKSIADLSQSAEHIRDPYYDANSIITGDAFSHSDLLANLILRVSGQLYDQGFVTESQALAKVNKVLHGIDFFPTFNVPKILKLVHPLGTVIGRSQLKSHSVIYQGVSVGARLPNSASDGYPTFEGPVILFAGASVFGNSNIEPNVVFGANSMIIDQDIPCDSIVVGRFPNHRVLPGASKIFGLFFDY